MIQVIWIYTALVIFTTCAYAQSACGECVSPTCAMMMCGGPEGEEWDDRPWYCKNGWSYRGCDDEGNIVRYYQRSSPYYKGPYFRSRTGRYD